MSGSVSAGYDPLYPVPDNLPEPEIRTFISNFYRISDRPEANALWVSQFTKDAHVAIGPGKANGEEELRTMREGMWSVVRERKHRVAKVFPGRFDESADGGNECELMLQGEVAYKTEDGQSSTVAWAGHGILRKVREEGGGSEEWKWKFAEYRVFMLK
ncbi:hypothetical protein Trco_000771 [Trichoderma cornu-damae]|uniref:SnoaL-like domain-containing protein n=1 Tax=Trichoderma cornu-damae TaxID=654480 RepID=A0A9P8QQY1_9HYPO|nr:hypothetical protein Trco_000771 [Trichoderma cornu-damae]